jgi:hypothetical protein
MRRRGRRMLSHRMERRPRRRYRRTAVSHQAALACTRKEPSCEPPPVHCAQQAVRDSDGRVIWEDRIDPAARTAGRELRRVRAGFGQPLRDLARVEGGAAEEAAGEARSAEQGLMAGGALTRRSQRRVGEGLHKKEPRTCHANVSLCCGRSNNAAAQRPLQ